jgi:HAE1 family hydrophobic/amphiphilic exporter-1
MSIYSVRRMIRSFALLSIITGACAAAALAQTPAATPVPITPAQQDATRPPGTQQNQPVPQQSRPSTDPTAPPGVVRPNPQTPPGVTVSPQTTQPSTTTETNAPVTSPTPNAPIEGGSTQTPSSSEPLREPVFTNQEARPLPPMPDITRLGVSSDNVLSLTLNDAIRLALENNNDIEVARGDVKFSETTLHALEGVFDPVFTFNPQLTRLVQSQPSTLGGATTLTQTDFQNNADISKTFGRGGGSYDFFFNNNRRTTNNSFSLLNPVFSSSLGVTFTQPLWRNRSIDRNRRDIRIQRKRLEQTDADFRTRTIDVIAQVQRAYWDLVFALRDQQNRIANINLSRENLRQVEARISAGSAAPLERAEVQTELANRESDLLLAAQNVSITENTLKQLMLRDSNAPQWSAQVMPTDEPSFDVVPVNLNDAIEEAKANRPELRRLRLQRDINNIDIQFFKNQTKPRIDFQSTIATTGLAGAAVATGGTSSSVPLIFGNPLTNSNAFLLQQINIIRNLPIINLGNANVPLIDATDPGVTGNLVGGYGQMLRNLFNFSTYNVVIGVTFQVPFRNRTAQANLAGARIQTTQLDASMRSQEQSVIVEVRNAAQAVETARRRVLSARAARENAELQLTGEQRLYQVGRSTTFILFQRENTLANARNAEIRAQTDYNKALADLQRATSTTLRANNITIETQGTP